MPVEVYIILSIVAAMVIGLVALPSRRGHARQFYARGLLTEELPDYPSVELKVLDDGSVRLTRRGLEPLSENSEINLSAEVIGFNVAIKEHIIPRPGMGAQNQAQFILKFFGRERYHISYTADCGQGFCAFTLNIRPGIVSDKPLTL